MSLLLLLLAAGQPAMAAVPMGGPPGIPVDDDPTAADGLALRSSDRTIALRNDSPGRRDLVIAEQSDEAWVPAIDGHGWVAGMYDVRLIDRASSTEHLIGERELLLGLVASPDGRWLYGATFDRGIVRWDLHRPQASPSTLVLDDFARVASDLAIDPAGEALLVRSGWPFAAYEVRLLDLQSLQWLDRLQVPPNHSVQGMEVSGDGRHVVLLCRSSAQPSRRLVVYDLQ